MRGEFIFLSLVTSIVHMLVCYSLQFIQHAGGERGGKGVCPEPCGPAAGRWRKEEEEEDLHQAQEEQAQEEEGSPGSSEVLQGG